MRRAVLITAGALALSAALLSPTPVRGQTGPDPLIEQLHDERRGMVFDGLRRRAGGPCGEAFEIVDPFNGGVTGGRIRCTHGPDPAPDGVDVRVRPEFEAPAPSSSDGPTGGAGTAAQVGIPCFGTGSDGYRFQLLYVRQAGTADKSATLFPNFVTWAAAANTAFKDSAAKTGGVRNVRFVTDAACNLVIQKVEVSAAAMGNFTTYISELRAKGFNRFDRKYWSWADATKYCGIAEIFPDDSPGTTPGLPSSNGNNGRPGIDGTFARVDSACWGKANSVEAHEAVHMIGGVQVGAPNATTGWHCKDESDRMCYSDTSGATMVQRCPVANERLLDCNNDDYFSTSPVGGSWLATHWNVASSAFLAKTNPSSPPPPPPPPPPTTTTTRPPTTTTRPPTTTTTRPPTTTTTTRPPPSTTTTLGPAGTPSAPRDLVVHRAGSGTWLIWSAPAIGPVTGYNVYRRTGAGAFTKIADLGTTTAYVDPTASPSVTYVYAVSAENGAREGPRSNQVTAPPG